MVAPPQAPPHVRLELCERIDALVRDGADAREAAKQALALLRREGFGEELGLLLNETAIAMDYWRHYVSEQRADKFPPHQGTRRYDPAVLSEGPALLETLHYVNGKWITLGDMLKGDCEALAGYWRLVEQDAAGKAVFMERIAAKLKADKRVRDQFSAADLEKLSV